MLLNKAKFFLSLLEKILIAFFNISVSVVHLSKLSLACPFLALDLSFWIYHDLENYSVNIFLFSTVNDW
jgi:hypothetical protein